MTRQHPRLITPDVRTTDLAPLALEPDCVLAGTPHASDAALARLGETDVGIWEITEGTVVDVEVDEVFVVVSGAATLTFHSDGSTVELGPGTVVLLKAGDRTTWDIRSTLRKIYVATPA